jgi:hypothetical protein
MRSINASCKQKLTKLDMLLMDNLPKKLVFWAYFISFGKRNNLVKDFFSIQALFRRENSLFTTTLHVPVDFLP